MWESLIVYIKDKTLRTSTYLMYGSNGFSLGSLKMSYQFSFIQEIVLKVGLTNFEK